MFQELIVNPRYNCRNVPHATKTSIVWDGDPIRGRMNREDKMYYTDELQTTFGSLVGEFVILSVFRISSGIGFVYFSTLPYDRVKSHFYRNKSSVFKTARLNEFCESSNMPVCRKCWRFGHYSSECTNKKIAFWLHCGKYDCESYMNSEFCHSKEMYCCRCDSRDHTTYQTTICWTRW